MSSFIEVGVLAVLFHAPIYPPQRSARSDEPRVCPNYRRDDPRLSGDDRPHAWTCYCN